MKRQFKEMNKMKIKSTSDLLKELSATENFDEFAKENKDFCEIHLTSKMPVL